MTQAQLLTHDARRRADLSVDSEEYFGAPLSEIDNASPWPLYPDDGPLTRSSYVYQAVYVRGNDYGGIQLRARTHTYGEAPDALLGWLRETAHRAAYLFDTSIQHPGYGPQGQVRGTDAGDGYLSGFNAVQVYRNTEKERISAGEMQTHPGVVDWSVEVYMDDDFDRASLSGIAQGIANPWKVEREVDEGAPAVSVAPHKWGLSWNPTREMYDVHPPARKQARDRFKPGGAAAEKTVYINDRPIGKLDDNGRTWLTRAYAGDPNTTSGGFGTYWSREGLVDETPATYQALRDGGTLYLTGETETAIYLTTARAKPEGYEAADPDAISPDLRVRPGSDGRTVRFLKLRGMEDSDALTVDGRRDERLDRHLGKSAPPYRHHLGPGQTWPPKAGGGR